LRNPNRQTGQPDHKMRAVRGSLIPQQKAPLPRERLRPPVLGVDEFVQGLVFRTCGESTQCPDFVKKVVGFGVAL